MPAVANGTGFLLLINGRYAMLVTGSNLSFENGTRDISARETNNWSTSVLGMREWTMEMEGKLGFTYEDGTTNSRHQTGATPPQTIQSMELTEIMRMGYFNQEKLWLGFVEFKTGATAWEGFAYLASVSVDAPNEDSCSINMSFKGMNEPNCTTVTNPAPPDIPDPPTNHY